MSKTAADLPRQTLGRYRIDAFIGAGGMGRVYRAYDATLGRSAAIKVLPRLSEARKLLADIQQRSRSEYISRYHKALVRLGLGEKQEAMTFLDRAADLHYPWVIHDDVEPVLDSLQGEPRFKRLPRRLGLPDLSGRFAR